MKTCRDVGRRWRAAGLLDESSDGIQLPMRLGDDLVGHDPPSAARILLPIGEPQPVHGSQPFAAE